MPTPCQKAGNKSAAIGEIGRNTPKPHVLNGLDSLDTLGRLNQLQKLAAMGQIASGFTHDFRNLLTGILLTGQDLVSSLPENSPVRDKAQRMLDLATCGSSLSHQFLSILRDSKEKQTIFRAHELLERVTAILRHALGPRIRIEKKLEAQIDTIRANPDHMLTTLLNLALNARDAMPTGGELGFATKVRAVSAGAKKKGNSVPHKQIEIAVSDTGAGMTPKTRAQLFAPFFTTKEGGVGLGLVSVHMFVQQSDGQMQVESKPGRGSVFRLTFPLWTEEPACISAEN